MEFESDIKINGFLQSKRNLNCLLQPVSPAPGESIAITSVNNCDVPGLKFVGSRSGVVLLLPTTGHLNL